MFIGMGTTINVVAIVVGSGFGIAVGHRLTKDSQKSITDVLGLITILGAVGALIPLWSTSFKESLPNGAPLLVILLTMLLGGFVGTALKLENRLDGFGENLRKRFKASEESPFVEGFVTASLLFVIGPLAILGSISDGMSQGIDQLLLKSSLDFFASMAFASTLGWGVAASIIPLGIYQGSWTIIGWLAGNVLEQYQIDAMTICGGLMLVAIGLRLLDIKKVAVGNLLPALFLAPLIATLVHTFN
jgi:uncharacterized membrane protein YqgA involved in biofilm formation